MLADLFPREKLPRAIAVLISVSWPARAALLLGRTVIHFVSNLGPVELPLVGALRPLADHVPAGEPARYSWWPRCS